MCRKIKQAGMVPVTGLFASVLKAYVLCYCLVFPLGKSSCFPPLLVPCIAVAGESGRIKRVKRFIIREHDCHELEIGRSLQRLNSLCFSMYILAALYEELYAQDESHEQLPAIAEAITRLWQQVIPLLAKDGLLYMLRCRKLKALKRRPGKLSMEVRVCRGSVKSN
ncbi:hypothetical protein GS399_15920 [Pedobacter sp. HMF7647]|uniref:Uncharacterized protein n=1 Tax=Hufsiella arboris TaxID=2695275 RepID=A0A7K1YD07_9SPHI|nr:hypothetical protein [Hufsiella arboris]MXV52463.1 hypothetical protein [Hufsiella arboris]